jgi:hypothetical protein
MTFESLIGGQPKVIFEWNELLPKKKSAVSILQDMIASFELCQ